MKKVAIALTLMLVLALCVACSGGGGAADKGTDLAGTKWVVSSANVSGQEVTGEQLASTVGEISFEFKDGGKFVANAMNQSQEGTYKLEGNKVTFDQASALGTSATIEGDKMTMEVQGMKITLTKQ